MFSPIASHFDDNVQNLPGFADELDFLMDDQENPGHGNTVPPPHPRSDVTTPNLPSKSTAPPAYFPHSLLLREFLYFPLCQGLCLHLLVY